MQSAISPLNLLVRAVMHSDDAACREILRERPDLVFYRISNSENNFAYAWHLAAHIGDVETGKAFVKTLHKLGQTPDCLRDRSQNTAQHYAALNGHENFVRMLIDHGSMAYVRNGISALPVHDAAKFGHTPLMKLYVDLCSPEVLALANSHRETPVHRASYFCNTYTMAYILNVIGESQAAYPALKGIFAATTEGGYTPYDLVEWRILHTRRNGNESLNAPVREKYEIMALLMREHGADIHSDTWIAQGDDATRAAHSPISRERAPSLPCAVALDAAECMAE